MDKFKFSPINWDLVSTSHIGLVYHNHDILADLEIAVQRPEAKRRGVPDDYPIATHVFLFLRVINAFTISKEIKFLFWKRVKKIALMPGLWVFEETVSGIVPSTYEKYKNATDIEIRKRVKPFMPNQVLAMQDSIIKYWQESIGYGWVSFFTQPEHTILDANVTTKTIESMQICSELGANVVNDACVAGDEPKDFPDPTNTNPLDVQLSDKYQRDTDVQPL